MDALAALDLPATVASVVPRWVWAALITAGFAAVSVLTMALARWPARRTPPPFVPDADERSPARTDDEAEER